MFQDLTDEAFEAIVRGYVGEVHGGMLGTFIILGELTELRDDSEEEAMVTYRAGSRLAARGLLEEYLNVEYRAPMKADGDDD